MEENSPLILQNVSRNGETSLKMPSTPGSDLLTFRTGEAVNFACPDANDNMFVTQNTPLMKRELTAVCKKGKIYICYQNQTTFSVFYRCTVHFAIYLVHTPTNALFINLVKSFKFTLKYTIISLLHVSVFNGHHQGALSVPN